MTYEDQFIALCDDKGKAPAWAVEQIFADHSADLEEWLDLATPGEVADGETILHWLGY